MYVKFGSGNRHKEVKNGKNSINPGPGEMPELGWLFWVCPWSSFLFFLGVGTNNTLLDCYLYSTDLNRGFVDIQTENRHTVVFIDSLATTNSFRIYHKQRE